MSVDISQLPPPPQAPAFKQQTASVDISGLPPPPPSQVAGAESGPIPPAPTAQSDISHLPPPPPPNQEPTGVAGTLTDQDIGAIAAKHQVDPQELKSKANYFAQADIKGESPLEFMGKQTAGLAGRVAFNLPQKAYKKFQDPKMESALDELEEIGTKQRGPVQMLAEGAALPLGEASKGVTILGSAARGARTGAAVGAAAGYGGSNAQNEWQSTFQGAVTGTVLGGIAGAAGGKASGIEKAATTVPEKALPDIDREVQAIASRTQKSEQEAAQVLGHILDTGEVPRLSDEAVEVISKEQFPQNVEPSRADAERFIENRIRGYAEDLTKERPKDLEKAISGIRGELTRGPEYIADRYKGFVESELAGKTGIQINKQYGFKGKAENYFSDSQYVLRDIDRRAGTNSEPALNTLNKDYNRSTFELGQWRNKMAAVYKANRKTVDGNTLFEEMTRGQVPAEHQEAADRVRKFFDEFYGSQRSQKGNGILPLNPSKVENYLPNYTVPVSEMIPRVESRLNNARQEASQILGRDIHDLSTVSPQEFEQVAQTPAGKDIISFAKWGRKEPVASGQELEQLIDKALNSREGKSALEINARSVLERTGDVPEFLKERNVYKLMDMYTANTIRGQYLRKGIDKLRYEAQKLRQAGADVDAQYIENLIQDVQGVRKGTAAEMVRDTKVKYYRFVDKLIEQNGGKETVTGSALTAVKALPDVLRELALQIYPAKLGLNVRSAIQNSTSALTKLAPELGGTYGYLTTGKAAVQSLYNFRKQYAKVKAMGLVPEGFVRNGEAAIAEGIQASALYQMPKQMIDGLSKGLMAFHQATEALNRVITLNVGEIMGRELASGSSAAKQALNRFPGTIRKQVTAAAGNAEEIGRILANHLNDTTQYNYNRMSMSEFGRTFGPMFSVFTKWPAATAGDIIATYREKGMLAGSARNAEKYLAPALLLHTLSMAVGQHSFLGAGDELSDRQKLVMGSSGLVQAAPIGNILSIIRGETGIPPAAAIAYHGIVKPLLEGKGLTSDSLVRTGGQMADSFTPGVGLLRFLTQDLVTYVTGRKPEGNFWEKTQEGAHRLNKYTEGL